MKKETKVQIMDEMTGRSSRKKAKKTLEEMKAVKNKKWVKFSTYFKAPATMNFYLEVDKKISKEQIIEKFELHNKNLCYDKR